MLFYFHFISRGNWHMPYGLLCNMTRLKIKFRPPVLFFRQTAMETGKLFSPIMQVTWQWAKMAASAWQKLNALLY